MLFVVGAEKGYEQMEPKTPDQKTIPQLSLPQKDRDKVKRGDEGGKAQRKLQLGDRDDKKGKN